MSDLAILGGQAQRTRPFPSWPQSAPGDLDRLRTVLESRNWGGYPFPNQLADEFARELGEFDSLETVRLRIREGLEKAKRQEAEQEQAFLAAAVTPETAAFPQLFPDAGTIENNVSQRPNAERETNG